MNSNNFIFILIFLKTADSFVNICSRTIYTTFTKFSTGLKLVAKTVDIPSRLVVFFEVIKISKGKTEETP